MEAFRVEIGFDFRRGGGPRVADPALRGDEPVLTGGGIAERALEVDVVAGQAIAFNDPIEVFGEPSAGAVFAGLGDLVDAIGARLVKD